MRAMRWVLLGLVLLLGWLQYRLWFGIGSAGEVAALESQVEHQRRENGGLQERNAALAAEVRDLKEGVAAVEERARSELGMIKPGEVFYRVVEDPARSPAAVGPADPGAGAAEAATAEPEQD
ncbi:cell division protein FtsB [Pseudoxanthomonas jiangsuensis]|uniref:cell division protein FtsB n=1 Tax=Pseudoxanthomonas jiangsuensis TaxID=619688 RepID=UPI0013915524|nr:cell division protein FtsB [Pseudoxanthomonas jiangsuensis]KAF1698386.1 cell division protein FtsB [Pseudoxanthomonas jiangsuensis]